MFNPFPNNKFSSEDNSKLHENGVEFPERIQNAVGKGEIACDEQFLLFQQCFQNTCSADW